MLVHPQFEKIGGAEKVALKIIEILISEFNANITILSTTDFDLELIQLQSGIGFNSDNITSQVLSVPSFMKNKFSNTRIALLHRKAKQLAPSFSYSVSTYNELDFGQNAFQYVHHPMLAPHNVLSSFKLATKHQFPKSLSSSIYRKFNDTLSKRVPENIEKNVTVTNSKFIQNIYSQIYGKTSRVIYPSIIGSDFKADSTNNKSKQILNISRFSSHKNVSALLNVFDQINESDPGFTFAIAGQVENQSYFDGIKNEVLSRNYPIKLFPDCDRNTIVKLYSESAYYINPKEYEHFGIAVLEAAKFGCIPLVHASGGSTELVPDTDLHFHYFDEIAQKISLIESTVSLKEKLKKNLADHISKFSEEQFEKEITDSLRSYFRMN